MCHQSTCDRCSRKTWFGCGSHVPMVMNKIPIVQWCTCEPKVKKDGQLYPPKGSV
ncbi:hypothetical protein BDV97DRAFT_279106, partial [Delphinella strobiligena]